MFIILVRANEKWARKWEFESEKRRKTSNIFMCNEGIAKNQQQNTDEIYIFNIFLPCQKRKILNKAHANTQNKTHKREEPCRKTNGKAMQHVTQISPRSSLMDIIHNPTNTQRLDNNVFRLLFLPTSSVCCESIYCVYVV